jgi:hypothetical protein
MTVKELEAAWFWQGVQHPHYLTFRRNIWEKL